MPFYITSKIPLLLFAGLLTVQLNASPGTFYVTDYGAVPGDDAADTEAIQSAIDASHSNGGGHVIVPPGDYEIGPLFLTSNLTFEIQAGATLHCTDDVGAFYKTGIAPTPEEASNWKGLHSDYQLINGKDLKNVTLTGKGTIHGHGSTI